MKKITLLMSLLITTVGFSQAIPVTFEDGIISGAKSGDPAVLTPADANWYSDSGLASASVEDLASDTPDNLNAGKIVSSSTGANWQNAQFSFPVGANYMDLTTDKTVTLDVYSVNAQNFLLKLEQALGSGAAVEKNFAHGGSGWETITVDFSTLSTPPNDQYKLMVIFPCWSTSFATAAFDSTTYVDNITTAVGDIIVATVTEPTTAPTTPIARDAGDVISIFSDAYTDVALGEIDPGWSPGVLSTIDFAGNNVWKITNCEFLAVTQYAGIDFSEMDKLHIDYWTPDTAGALVNIKIVDTATGAEQLIPLGNTVSGSWQSVEVDLSLLTIDVSAITQILYDPTSEGKIHFVDNFYFYKEPTAGVEDISSNSVKMYPNPSNGVVNFSSASNEAIGVTVYDLLGKQVMGAQNVQSQLNISSLNPGMYFVNMTQGSSTSTKKLVVK